jgi:hypothetical protein
MAVCLVTYPMACSIAMHPMAYLSGDDAPARDPAYDDAPVFC